MRRIDDDASVWIYAFDHAFQVSKIALDDDDLIADKKSRRNTFVGVLFIHGKLCKTIDVVIRRFLSSRTTVFVVFVVFIFVTARSKLLNLIQRRGFRQFHRRQRASFQQIPVFDLVRSAQNVHAVVQRAIEFPPFER